MASPNGGAMATAAPGTSILQPWTPQQLAQCQQASAIVRQVGERFQQQIFQQSFVPVFGQPTTINVPVQPVGMITKFYAVVSTVVTNPGGGNALTRGSFGPFSTMSLVQYTDPNSNIRISTPGWHLAAVTARRHRRVPGSAISTDSPSGFGAVLSPIACPSSIAAGGSGTVSAIYEIPLAIGRQSLKGAVFSGAVFATQQLSLTFNPNFAQSGSDPLGAVFTGAGTGANAPTYATQVTVYQEYWDQFPLQLLNALSPDLSTMYEIKMTSLTGLVAGSDNYVRYTNLRQFLSTTLAFDNGGTLNAGGDINYFMLQSANQTTKWKRSASLQSYLQRNMFGDDFPAGVYMFDSSDEPISTAAEGNTVLSLNPSTVNANAVLWTGWEDIGVSSVLASAPSLSGGAGVG
jgi:hypothetical protein